MAPTDGGSTVSISSMDIKEGKEGTTLLVTIGEGKIKRLKRTKSRHAITTKAPLLRMAHIDGKYSFTLNNANIINTFRTINRLIFQIRPAADTSRHRRTICRKTRR